MKTWQKLINYLYTCLLLQYQCMITKINCHLFVQRVAFSLFVPTTREHISVIKETKIDLKLITLRIKNIVQK